MKALSWSLAVLLTTTVFFGCTDHQDPGAQRMRIKKLSRTLPDQPGYTLVSLLGYGDQGRLDSIYTYQNPDSANGQKEISKFNYNNQGYLTEVTRKRSLGGAEQYLYTYDGPGKLVSIKYTGADKDYYDFVPAYDGDGNLTTTTRSFRFFSSISYRQQNQYIFSGGNLSRLISTATVEKVIPATSVSTTDFVYDDKPNPFYGIALIPAPVRIASPTSANFSHYTYCGGIDNLFHLSKNNPTSSNIKGYTQTLYHYQYNQQGLPQSRQTLVKPMLDLPAALTETLLFEYEKF